MLQLAVLATETWHVVWPRQLVKVLARSAPVELPIAYSDVATWNGKDEQSDVICCVAGKGAGLGPATGCWTPYGACCKGARLGSCARAVLLPSPKSRMAVQGLIPANACNPEARTPARTLPSTYLASAFSQANCAVDTVCKLAESYLTTRKSKMLPKMGQFQRAAKLGRAHWRPSRTFGSNML